MSVAEHSLLDAPTEKLTASSYPLAGVIGLCSILFFGVLAFGAGDIWANSVLEMLAALLFAVTVVDCCARATLVRWNPLYPPMLAFGAVAAFQAMFNLTAYRYATLLACLQYLSYAAVFFVAAQVATDARFSKFLILTFSAFGAAVAVFSICQYLSGTRNFYWLVSPGTGSNIFGPYVNRDHYAGLMEMLMPPALVLGLSRLLNSGQRALVAFAAVVMAGSIVLAGSRGGVVSLAAELTFLVWVATRSARGSLVRRNLLMGIALMLAFLAFIGSSSMWSRFGDVQETFRPGVLKDSLRMFLRKPVLGWGLGTFQTVYPRFRSFYTTAYVNAAHNDYLQALVETGMLGFGCVMWFVIALYRNALTDLRYWNQSWRQALQLSALVGCTGLLVHSAFDFNLQVPANAALFYALSALAAGLGRKLSTTHSMNVAAVTAPAA